MQDPVAAPSPMRAYKRMGDEEEGKSFNDDMAEAEAMEVVAPEAPPQELPAQEALDAFEEANPEARAILVPSCVVTAIGFALLGSQMLQLAGLYVVPGFLGIAAGAFHLSGRMRGKVSMRRALNTESLLGGLALGLNTALSIAFIGAASTSRPNALRWVVAPLLVWMCAYIICVSFFLHRLRLIRNAFLV